MRTLTYANMHRYGPVECENLVLMCIDYRFCRQVAEALKFAGYGDFDLLSMPGGAKSIVSEKGREVAFQALDIVIDVHKVRKLVIVDHTDCRAYGGSEAFSGPEEEEDVHVKTLREAAGIIQGKYPNLEVELFYTDWDRLTPVAL